MNIRSSLACTYIICALATPLVMVAQSSDTLSLTVMTFHGKEPGLGSRAADILRDRLANDFSADELHVVTTADVVANLEAAGFSVDDSLPANDERRLANLLRADVYLTGRITQAYDGTYQLEPRLVMSVDQTLVEPLRTVSKKELDDLTGPVSKSVKAALKQLEGNRKCIAGVNIRNFAMAIAGARAAIAAYPRATIARLCLAKAFYAEYLQSTSRADSVAYADSVLAVSAVVLQEDSLNVSMLQYNAALYRVLNDTARERQALLSLVRSDPSNGQLIERVINSLAGEGHVQDAVPLVKDMTAKNPGDAHTLDLAFKVYAAAQDWPSIISVGVDLIKADTAAADTTYFIRMAAAYEKEKKPLQKMALLSQATAKFPTNAWFWLSYGAVLKENKQPQQAADALRRFLSMNPTENVGEAYANLVSLYGDMDVPDSVYAVAQRAAQDSLFKRSSFISVFIVAATVLKEGNNLVQTATALANATAPGDTVRAKLQNALRFLQLSSQISPRVDTQILMGAATFQIMQSAVEEAGKTKSCGLARLAQQSSTDARTVLDGIATSADAGKYKQQAQDILGYLPKFQPAIGSQILRFCK